MMYTEGGRKKGEGEDKNQMEGKREMREKGKRMPRVIGEINWTTIFLLWCLVAMLCSHLLF